MDGNRIMKRLSQSGFWAVARAGSLLRSSGWHFWCVTMLGRRRILLEGNPWILEQPIYVGNDQKIRKKYISLTAEKGSLPKSKRQGNSQTLKKLLVHRLRKHGYRLRPDRTSREVFFFEKVLHEGRNLSSDWDRLDRIISGELGTRIRPRPHSPRDIIPDIIRCFRALSRRGWKADHLDLRGPTKRIKAGGRSWTLHSALYWYPKEGITLHVDIQGGPYSKSESQSLHKTGVIPHFGRQLRVRGVRTWNELHYKRRWVFIDASRRKISPGQVMVAVNKLQDWKNRS